MSALPSLPKLGFGLMRLPKTGDAIDYTELQTMADEAMKQGCVYFDTAYVYHGGESEKALKRVIVDKYPRDSYFAADKLPAWELSSKEDITRVFNEQLERTGLEYFDFYLLHSVNQTHIVNYDSYGCWEWGKEMKAKGLIKHFGFSFHDTPELLDKVLTDHPEAEFVQLQINYADWDNQIVYSGKCYEVAKKHNVPVIVMEPVRGGGLASLRPEWEEILKAAAPGKSIASWAMRFCLALDNAIVTLSGMSNLEQMKDNLATVKDFKPFSAEEKTALDKVVKEYLAAPVIGCTACRYCVDGCPSNINIPEIIKGYNTIITYGEHARPHMHYKSVTEGTGKAGDCVSCGQCEGVCPQHLEIIEIMGKISAVFDKEK